MGKIKQKLVRRTAKELVGKQDKFNEDFKNNKKILNKTISSKKLRNQTAGLISNLKKQEKEKESMLQLSK